MAFAHPHCGGSHETIAEARVCENVPAHEVPAESPPEPRHEAPAERPPRKGPAEEGFYKHGNVIYKVQTAKHGSGRRYAKIMYKPEEPGGKPRWEYAPGVVNVLQPEDKLSAADAAAFGKLYGICIFCSRDLTDERSIAVGYGAVCADNHGLPWGEVA